MLKNKKADEVKARLPNEEISRTIKISADVWAALQADAERCRRSANKQIEAVLVALYGLDDVELPVEGLRRAREDASSPHVRRMAG